MKNKNKKSETDMNEELFTEVGDVEKVELSHPAVTYGKRLLKFIGENFSVSPGLMVSGKKIPVSFTLRFPITKLLKQIKP